MSLRIPTEVELRQYAYQLQPLLDSAPGFAGNYEPEDAVASLLAGGIESVLIDEAYLFLYVVAPPWYNASLSFLYEVGLYRVEYGGSFRGAVKGMEDIARSRGATRINVGTSLPKNKEALARLYQRCGFEVSAIALYKEIR